MVRQNRWILVAVGVWIVSGPNIDTATADDVQVNTYTTGDQIQSSVAMAADGDFIVVWSSEGSSGTDSSSSSVQGQRYASDGSTVGGEFQVNSYTTGFQVLPMAAFDADGDFVVVWSSDGSSGTDTSSPSIQARRYASDGSTIGGQFQVNSYTTSDQIRSSVAMAANGDFVVVWYSIGSGGTDSSYTSILGQRFASDGAPIAGEFQVNSYTTGIQRRPSVASNAEGDFVVVWASTESATDSSHQSVHGQRFASNGLPAGGQFQVNTYTTDRQSEPSVAVEPDGDFVIVWNSLGSGGTDTLGSSIQGKRYASDGSPLRGEFQVNTYTTYYQGSPSVALNADGHFVVVWGIRFGGPSPPNILGQGFDSEGCPLDSEFQVNTYTTADSALLLIRPDVSLAADGHLVVVWDTFGSCGTDTESASVQKTPAALIFRDGFETGDTSAWSSQT